jgi:general secretion pathway protein E
LAQRLVRKLCPHCARPHRDAAHWASRFRNEVRGIAALGPPDIREARGCGECGGLGFAGRATIAEILLVNADIHRLILSATSDSQIDDAARKIGMISIYETGAAKVWRGETTIDEVLRATRME